jgi:hypothetical protein
VLGARVPLQTFATTPAVVLGLTGLAPLGVGLGASRHRYLITG